MSKVTLESLREEFKTARDNHAGSCHSDFLSELIRDWTPEFAASHFRDDLKAGSGFALHRAAKLYVIARDEGLEAAMLWKLQQP